MKIYMDRIPKVKRADKVVLITSAKLKRMLGLMIETIEKAALPGFEIIIIPDGEEAKEWSVLGKLLAKFAKLGLTKKSVAIAFGGGSVSDLVGFACANYKGKAVSYINIPTTLLAQVDASFGGKTAINFAGHKNLLRAFYNPLAIFRGAGFLQSLSREQFIDGIAEIIKYGLIYDPKILDILDCCTLDGLRKDRPLLEGLILRSVTAKQYFVSQDPEDNGIRQGLNLGHTLAHALELKYRLSHGMAVLCGIAWELKVLAYLGINTSVARARFKRILKCLGIKLNLKRFEISPQDFAHDKKISGKEIVIPVVTEVGKVELVEISLEKLMVAVYNCN